VLSKSWLTNRFRSFSVLLPYQQIPCGRDHRWLTAKLTANRSH
jgi:hypothetical protein